MTNRDSGYRQEVGDHKSPQDEEVDQEESTVFQLRFSDEYLQELFLDGANGGFA